jgi:penicillin-binding protein 2
MQVDTYDGDGRRFRRRLKGLALVAVLGLGLLMARIVWLQVVRHDDYAVMAEQNRAAAQPSGQPPAGAR